MVMRARAARILTLALLVSTLLAGCLSDDGEPDDLIETAEPGESIVVPTASPTATIAPTPTTSEWISALLEPGPTTSPPPAVFFLNGPDVWIVNDDLTVTQVTRERRIRAVATAPDGSQAAAVFLATAGGRETEEVRLIDSEGEESDPLYGPEVVSAPAANPRVRELIWSPAGDRVAIVRGDGSIWLVGPEAEAEELLAGGEGVVERVAWAPSGAGLVVLTRPPGGTGVLHVVSLVDDERVTITPQSSFGDAGWLPGQARLVVTEDRQAGATPAAGSLFTLLPDGSDRALLLSAGEFGPVVELSHLTPSPNGAMLAFVVNAPNPEGLMEFQALWVLELESGVRRQFAVASGQGVNDIWWVEGGLVWRATRAEPDATYDGAEPFILEFGSLETGQSQLIFTAE